MGRRLFELLKEEAAGGGDDILARGQSMLDDHVQHLQGCRGGRGLALAPATGSKLILSSIGPDLGAAIPQTIWTMIVQIIWEKEAQVYTAVLQPSWDDRCGCLHMRIMVLPALQHGVGPTGDGSPPVYCSGSAYHRP